MLYRNTTISSRENPPVPHRTAPLRRGLCLCLFLCLAGMLAGCAGKVSPEDMRNSLYSGEIQPLRATVEAAHTPGEDLDIALNLGRLYQMDGQWKNSIAAYEEATVIIEEYERRAIINMRELGGESGVFTLARGTKGYFGAGYERSLLHTFNSLNYLMLRDFQGAAVELRKMEKRQEYWLEESAERIRQAAQRNMLLTSPEDLPEGYSLRHILNDPRLQSAASNYQEPFSYALSAVVHTLAEDTEFATVSRERALALSPASASLFPGAATAPEAKKAKGAPTAAGSPTAEGLNLMVLAFSGLAPALYMERVRTFAPFIGYVAVDLPSYLPPLFPAGDPRITVNGRELEALPLLATEALAYRNMRDELAYETAAAVSRAIVRAGVSAGAYAAARSHEDTRQWAWAIGALTTLVQDLASMSFDDNVRNWETLPARGYITLGTVPAGGELTVAFGSASQTITLPREGAGVIVLVSHLSNSYMRVDYVHY